MASINNIWIPKLHASQLENYVQIEKILKDLKKNMMTVPNDDILNARDSQKLMNHQLKKYHIHISKCAKRMDAFRDDCISVGLPTHDSTKMSSDPYVKLCADHMCHLGKRKIKVEEDFVGKGCQSKSDLQVEYIDDICDVFQALQSGADFTVAEDWIFDKLSTGRISESVADHLAFFTAKLKFLTLLTSAPTSRSENFIQALEMSQVLFPQFYIKNVNVSELNEMICCLLFVNSSASSHSSDKATKKSQVQSSPCCPQWLSVYPHLSVQAATQQVCEAFQVIAAELHGLPRTSALRILLNRGIGAVSLFRDSKDSSTYEIDHLPQQSWAALEHVCFPLPRTSTVSSTALAQKCKREPFSSALSASSFSSPSMSIIFHSILTCPVSREMASQDNLPVLLQCGHVIVSSSMTALPSSRSGRFKCPTCYHEMRQDSCKVLHL